MSGIVFKTNSGAVKSYLGCGRCYAVSDERQGERRGVNTKTEMDRVPPRFIPLAQERGRDTTAATRAASEDALRQSDVPGDGGESEGEEAGGLFLRREKKNLILPRKP